MKQIGRLGRGRNVKYDCIPVADVLKNFYVIGFIAAPVRGCITNKPWEVGGVCDTQKNEKYLPIIFNPGDFLIKDFSISIREVKA